jgi:hypothetical protein
VPLERILVESDHGEPDPPAAIPLRIGWVEHLVAQRFGCEPSDVRRVGWQNLADLLDRTGTAGLLPASFRGVLSGGGRAAL